MRMIRRSESGMHPYASNQRHDTPSISLNSLFYIIYVRFEK